MGKILLNRGQWLRGCWLVVVVLSGFITIQLSPYLALAALTPGVPSPTAQVFELSDADLLAQLGQLPNGTVSLPNFDPAVNGFQFSNQELVQAIDLDRNAQNWEVVLTEQMEQLFGTQVCVGEGSGLCVLTAAAQSWLKTQLSRLDQGISEGMAAAVLELWQPTPTPIPWWQRLINALLGHTVFGLVRTLFDLQTFIANLFLMQGVTEVFQPTETIRNTLTPTQILLTILRVFLTGSGNPFTMGVYRLVEGVLTEGHSLTPYRVEDRGHGNYWVYVYDSNYPAGRATSPQDLHVEFDTQADTWVYRPLAPSAALSGHGQGKRLDEPAFFGDAASKNLDLTQRSWRQPAPALTGGDRPAATGPFTCPFCHPDRETAPEAPPEPTVDITLSGEGHILVAPYGASGSLTAIAGLGEISAQDTRVPFKGGLNRAVPASYHLTAAVLGQPLQVTLTGAGNASLQPTTLQVTGPGYTANVEGLLLSPEQTLTLYVVPNATGPELTFVANQITNIPHLTINLIDATTTHRFDASTPEVGFALTERQVSKSSGFDLSGVNLPAQRRVALSAKTDLKRLYFADDDLADSAYTLTVNNRMVVKDRTQLGASQPDFVNYTLTYDEEMRVRGVQVKADHQAFFDYNPAFIDPADLSRDALLAALAQRNIPITIAYEPLAAGRAGASSPLRLVPSGAAPIGQQVFQGSLGFQELVWETEGLGVARGEGVEGDGA